MRFSVVVFVMLCFCLNGCSVIMALKGTENPDLGALHEGQSREEVIDYLGEPEDSTQYEDGRRVDEYKLEWGNEPSIARALLYGVLDFFTFFVWELFGTPQEALKSEVRALSIEYDQDEKVSNIFF